LSITFRKKHTGKYTKGDENWIQKKTEEAVSPSLPHTIDGYIAPPLFPSLVNTRGVPR
jgi:hypothetical protein